MPMGAPSLRSRSSSTRAARSAGVSTPGMVEGEMMSSPRAPPPDARDLLGHLLAGQVSAHAGLGALSDLDLDR